MAKNQEKNTVTEEITLPEVAPQAALTVTDFSADEFAGDEDKLTAQDILPTVQRFRIVQGMTKGQRDHGLRPGQIFATASKTGYDELLIAPVHFVRSVVERKSVKGPDGKSLDGDGDFIAELDPNDPRVVAAFEKNKKSFVKLRSAEGTDFRETLSTYFAMLDPNDGLTCVKLGILVAESTNIAPVQNWRTERVGFKIPETSGWHKLFPGKTGSSLPMYAFRAFVNGEGVHSKNETCLYQFRPFKGNNWRDSVLDPSKPDELALLRSLKQTSELIKEGKLTVQSISDADDSGFTSEDAAEAAAF